MSVTLRNENYRSSKAFFVRCQSLSPMLISSSTSYTNILFPCFLIISIMPEASLFNQSKTDVNENGIVNMFIAVIHNWRFTNTIWRGKEVYKIVFSARNVIEKHNLMQTLKLLNGQTSDQQPTFTILSLDYRKISDAPYPLFRIIAIVIGVPKLCHRGDLLHAYTIDHNGRVCSWTTMGR